jgi:transmembrane protein 33
MAVTWILSPLQTWLSIFPFTIYSIFHILAYIRGSLIPTIFPPTGSIPNTASKMLGDAIRVATRASYDGAMATVSIVELWLWFRILISVLFSQKDSWVLLCAYSAFLRARFEQSTFTVWAITTSTKCLDALFEKESTLPVVKRAWNSIKDILRQVAEITDLDSYTIVADSMDGHGKTY